MFNVRSLCGLLISIVGALAAHAAEPGVFTTAQAQRGAAVYAQHCAGCHGAELQGATAQALTGTVFAASWGKDSFSAQSMGRPFSVDDLAYFVSTVMPPGGAKQIPPDEHAAVLAFLLERNGFESGLAPLALGAPNLKNVILDLSPAAASAHDGAPPPAFVQGRPEAVPHGGGPSQQELNGAAESTRDWLYHNHDYAGARFVALNQITAANVAGLQVACALQLGDTSTMQSGPIVYNGVMYVTTNTRTVALDAADCRVKWRHVWQLKGAPGWTNNRGVAIKDGYVVRGTSDGYLLALNAETGELVWARHVADSAQGETITMPPLMVDDLILIGPAGSENAVSGWIGAFKLADGAPVWKFKTVPGADQSGGESWGQVKDVKVGGGAVWTPLSLDPAAGELYVAVTNPAPDFAAGVRPGENLYTNSIVALDVHTGALRWYKQTVPNDSHDWDLTQVSPLISLGIDGKLRRLVVTAGKDGMLRTLDRDTHEALYATPVTTIENVDAPITVSGTRSCPGILGGVEWSSPAYNPATKLLYVGAVDWCTTYWSTEEFRFMPGRMYLGGAYQLDPVPGGGWITAVDAATGTTRWRYKSSEPVLAGVTTTSGNLVFAGETTGDFIALDATSGKVLYRFNTGGGIGGGIVTYAMGGRQYVAVASGPPGANFVRGNPGTPTLFVFALPEAKP